MYELWQLLFGFFPAWFQAFLMGFFALLVIVIVMKIVAFVLDAIPFL